MKFVIRAQTRARLMEQLEPQLRADANADETAHYPIVSLYYDNDERDCYWEKIRGSRNRRKFRVRVYGSDSGHIAPTVFIEVKHKQEGRGVKRRINIPLEDALRVGRGEWPKAQLNDVDKRTCEEIIRDLVERRGFKPVMVMRYDRRAYAAMDPASDLRLTYDTGIAYRFDNLVPYALSVLLAESKCHMQSHSKYCNALERSDPVLRAMLAPNWRRPLQYAGA